MLRNLSKDEKDKVDRHISDHEFVNAMLEPEVIFDHLTLLATSVFDTSTALITFMNKGYVIVRSATGFAETRVPSDRSLCSLVVDRAEMISIDDMKASIEFSSHPVVKSYPDMRFYAGAPIFKAGIGAIGTFCIMDNRPREFSSIQKQRLLKFAALVSDILEIREDERAKSALREDLIRQQSLMISESARLAALGEMAAGIAHEINNPLSAILARASLILRESQSAGADLNAIRLNSERIETICLRISKIVNGLKNFSKESTSEDFTVVTIGQIFEDVLELCRERFRNHGVDFQSRIPDPSIEIRCRPYQIGQVLLNLLNNAFDAVVENEASSRWVRVEVREADRANLEIDVLDSGKGVHPDVRPKIFEPFFTTKGVGKGTGMGLSISRGIVQAHQGDLALIESRDGTAFRMQIPKNSGTSI